MVTDADIIKEIMDKYDEYRSKWLKVYGNDRDYDKWFTAQVTGTKEGQQFKIVNGFTYTEGNIIVNSWGYDQTNQDFYKIIKRSGQFVTLQPLLSIEKSNGALSMTGTCIPGEPDPKGKIIRRKVHSRDGRESGIAIESYGWASLWDGKPEHFSSYA